MKLIDIPFEDRISYLLKMSDSEFSTAEQTILLKAGSDFIGLDPASRQETLQLLKNDTALTKSVALDYPPTTTAGIIPELVNLIFDCANDVSHDTADIATTYLLLRFQMEKNYLRTIERKPPFPPPKFG